MEKQKRILVVDDERLNINVLVDLLKPDYKMIAAKNGEIALKAARSANRPDLILLDIMMPDMDGYEVCRQLKADEKTKDIPIIFVTAMGEASDETKGLELGAVDYITKPISPPIVKARVKTQLALKQHYEELQDAYGIIEAQKERMQEELNVGRDIQMSMLPRKFPPFPDRNEFYIFATLHPAREVGGDLYDFFFIDENRFCICIGDVSGKGVPAALFMAMTKTVIKSRASDDLSTASIITHVNDELSRGNDAYMFVTLFIGILDVRTGDLLFTNAGHNPPYIKRNDGTLKKIDNRHGPVAAAMGGLAYKEDNLKLNNGDLLLMYTDGVTEAKNTENKLFSEERLEKLLLSQEYETVTDMVQATVAEVKKFEHGREQFDDITVLAVQFNNTPEDNLTREMNLTIKNDLSELERVKNEFNNFSEQNEIPKPISRRINVVLDDMLNNIISYAYTDEKEHSIQLDMELSGERLILTFIDDGIPFNPFIVATPDTTLDLDDRTRGGLGIHLIRNVMDKYYYQRRVDRNVVTLVKLLTYEK